MKLKKIRLAGFKSFVQETEVELDAGFTAIVGPNGCGKTNILDAVRWVLGEKSARNLRGKSMDDVIFQGSANRKPAGMAEVELLFSNTDRSVGLDLDEILVGRRIYLNSASEYLLNGKKTTRREIERIFMDTGVGKAAYSIMEQGRMSEILQATAEDRRELFDEAAGIARFKAEKFETMARLDDTSRNLERLQDILKTRESELGHLETQASRTRRYLELKEKLDQADRSLRFFKYTDQDTRQAQVEQKLQELLSSREKLQQELSDLDQSLATRESRLEEEQNMMQALDREYHQDVSQINSLEQNIERARVDRLSQNDRLAGLDKKKLEEEFRLKEARRKQSSTMQLELNLSEEIRLITESLEKVRTSISGTENRIKNSESQEEAIRSELSELEVEQARIIEELRSVTEQFLIELNERRQELLQNDEKRNAHRGKVLDGIKQLDETLQKALVKLAEDEPEDSLKLLQSLSTAQVEKNFLAIEELDRKFRAIFFEEQGWLSRKAALDNRMQEAHDRKQALARDLNLLLERRRQDRTLQEKERKRSVEMELQLQDFKSRLASSAEMKSDVERHLKDIEEALRYFTEEIKRCRGDNARLVDEEQQLSSTLEEAQSRKARQFASLEKMRQSIDEIKEDINSIKEQVRLKREQTEKLLPSITDQERKAEQIRIGISVLEEELYNDFQWSLSELVDFGNGAQLNRSVVEEDFKKLKEEIRVLGQFNPLAIDELERAREVMAEIVRQKSDVEEARSNVMDLLSEIDAKSARLFEDTFIRIQNNFSEVFQKLFGGGTASLTLTTPENVLHSGVEIMAQPPGKKNASISLLSGGEQNMTAIALMFAIYLVRPSPFCFLDEIDAPLDDQNVARFLKMLSGFLGRSQFLVITHNKLTMTHADSIYGVTQEEAGVSKLVSVRFKDEALVS